MQLDPITDNTTIGELKARTAKLQAEAIARYDDPNSSGNNASNYLPTVKIAENDIIIDGFGLHDILGAWNSEDIFVEPLAPGIDLYAVTITLFTEHVERDPNVTIDDDGNTHVDRTHDND